MGPRTARYFARGPIGGKLASGIRHRPSPRAIRGKQQDGRATIVRLRFGKVPPSPPAFSPCSPCRRESPPGIGPGRVDKLRELLLSRRPRWGRGPGLPQARTSTSHPLFLLPPHEVLGFQPSDSRITNLRDTLGCDEFDFLVRQGILAAPPSSQVRGQPPSREPTDRLEKQNARKPIP